MLTLNALNMAPEFRNPREGLIHNSDRGSNYTANNYRKALTERANLCGMSSKDNYRHNAASESFFATIKKDLIHRFSTRREAAAAIFEYVEVFNNLIRNIYNSVTLARLSSEETINLLLNRGVPTKAGELHK